MSLPLTPAQLNTINTYGTAKNYPAMAKQLACGEYLDTRPVWIRDGLRREAVQEAGHALVGGAFDVGGAKMKAQIRDFSMDKRNWMYARLVLNKT